MHLLDSCLVFHAIIAFSFIQLYLDSRFMLYLHVIAIGILHGVHGELYRFHFERATNPDKLVAVPMYFDLFKTENWSTRRSIGRINYEKSTYRQLHTPCSV